jgi:hypothetical protein
VADAVVVNIAGLLAAKLTSTSCKKAYLHDVRHAVARAELPALAVYVSEEEIVEGRGGKTRHECVVELDYYLGPIEGMNLNERWADLRTAAKKIAEAVIAGADPNWPTPIVPPPTPPQSPAPGTPVLTLVTGLQAFVPSGKVKYGYFHPIAPTQGTSYLGFRWQLAVLHDDTYEPADITPLGPMFGTLTLAAEGALPVFNFVEFRPLAAP